MRRPLVLGTLAAEGFGVRRSGLTWLRPDGHECRAGELIALAQLRVVNRGAPASLPLAQERTLQVALAPPVAGRLRIEDRSSGGGWMDSLAVHEWEAGEIVASIETQARIGNAEALPLRLLMLAGRRMTWAMDVDTGLLPGWNLYARAWWGETEAPSRTLLNLGVCDSAGFLRGDQGGFAELFEAASLPAHMVHASEHPVAPCAPILLEQLLRTPEALEEISADLRRYLGKGPVAPTAEDYIFAGALLAQMSASPLRERYDLLGPWGLKPLGPAEVVLLSAAGEPTRLLRHRRLGYALQVHGYNRSGAGPAMRLWLERAFETVVRSADDIRQDLERLIDAAHGATGARFIVINRMSSSGRETVGGYAAFDAPVGATVQSVAAKAMNLMLHDLAGTRPVSILDLDALAAEFGGRRHLPDGLHQSGPLQDAMRRELLTLLQQPVQSTRKSMAMAAS